MRSAAEIMVEIASAGLTPAQLALVMELSATVAAEARPVVDEAAERRRERDREYQAERRRQMSADVGRVGDDPSLDKKVSRTLPKIKPIPSPPIIPQIMEAWNALAKRHGLPQVERIAGKREKALRARIAEHGFDAVLRAIANVEGSPHWLGANGWLGNLDSLLRPDNFQRMLENTYAGKAANANRSVDPEQVRKNKLALAEIYDRQGRSDEAERLRKEAA
jgi:hypothetical protein